MKIYEVLKCASVHLPVVIHYSTGSTTNSASLVLKRVRIRCARRCCCKVFSGRRCISSAVLAHYSTGTTFLSIKGMQRRFCCKVFSGKLLYCPLFDGTPWVLACTRKQRRKNAVVLAAEVEDSLLWVERHSGKVTGLPSKERLQKRIHWSLQLLFCFPAGTVNFLLLRHENMDRLPSFAVNLDEDPTDIFGAVCALLVCSALLKNCNNYLLDNKTFLWPCLQWKEYCDFWVNSSANSTKIKLARWDMVLKSLLSTFTSVFCTVYSGQELCPVIFCPTNHKRSSYHSA